MVGKPQSQIKQQSCAGVTGLWLMWALYHMFTYVSKEIGKTFFGVSLSMYRKYVHAMMFFLSEACFDMVSWYQCKTA